jgi:hypothetical protein
LTKFSKNFLTNSQIENRNNVLLKKSFACRLSLLAWFTKLELLKGIEPIVVSGAFDTIHNRACNRHRQLNKIQPPVLPVDCWGIGLFCKNYYIGKQQKKYR